ASSLARADTAVRAGDVRAAREGAAQALDIARRPFLAGETGLWVESRRRDLQDMVVRALDRLTDAALAAGDAEAAAGWARRAVEGGGGWAREGVEREPLREAGYQRLMRAYAAADNQAEALLTYERCRKLLAEELGAHPSPATQALHGEILRGDRVGPSVRPDPPAPAAQPGLATARLAPRRRRRVAVAAAGCALFAVAAYAAITGRLSGGSVRATGANGVGRIDETTGRVTAYTDVGAAPSNVAVGEGGVWVLDADEQKVSLVDPKARR